LQSLTAQGKTIFINSHLLQEVELVCDRVAILDHGELLHQGPIAALTVRADAQARIIVAAREDALRRALDCLPLVESRSLGGDQFEVLLKTNEQATIDGTIDRLRQQGVSLISLSRGRQTLEEAFLEILARARDKR
jgi:ABC-2 type transport system ATP-binding protein